MDINSISPTTFNSNNRTGRTALGICIGGFTGASIGSILMSDKVMNIAKQHAERKSNYMNAIKEGYTMIWDKNMKPVLSEYRHNRTLAKLGENPIKAGRWALGITLGLASLGAIIGFITDRKTNLQAE